MQSLTHLFGCVGNFFSGLFGLTGETPALADGDQELTGLDLHLELSDVPEVPTLTAGVATEVLPGPVGPTTAWWLETPAPLSESLVASLSRRLQGTETLSARERISLAFQRGQQGASIRRGDRDWFSGDRCTLRNRCYVVLRGGEEDLPFFTWDLATHQRAVRTGPGGTFSHRAISHGFASLAEAVAFSLGAGLPGLPRTI